MSVSTIRVEISSLAHGGYGVGRIDGQVCFVPYALPGDTVQMREVRRSKGVIWGVVEGIDEASPHRLTESRCPRFGECGACTWLHFAYPAQAEWKQRIVRESLNRIGRLDTEIGWLENPELRLGYRTRAEFHGDGRSRGFCALKSHQIVDVEECPLCHEKLNRALTQLRSSKVSGPVEFVINPEGEEVLVWTKDPLPMLRNVFASAESRRNQDRRASFVFDGVPIVNGTFSQSSLLLNRVLVGAVHRAIGDAARVLDLYCGSGNFSLGLPDATEVLGLDQSKIAVAAAEQMQRGSYRADNEDAFPKAIQSYPWDVILLDPPRTGAAAAVVDALADTSAGRIVYVSCDPATLARDLRKLTDKGWRIASLTAVDMFPNTAHVETACRLER